MRFILSTLIVAAVALTVLASCQSAAKSVKVENTPAAATPTNTTVATKTDEHGHSDEAPRITLADAKKEFDAGTAIFVDTRAESAFRQEHIKGAINIPAEAFETRYKEIPAGKKIIAYCS